MWWWELGKPQINPIMRRRNGRPGTIMDCSARNVVFLDCFNWNSWFFAFKQILFFGSRISIITEFTSTPCDTIIFEGLKVLEALIWTFKYSAKIYSICCHMFLMIRRQTWNHSVYDWHQSYWSVYTRSTRLLRRILQKSCRRHYNPLANICHNNKRHSI